MTAAGPTTAGLTTVDNGPSDELWAQLLLTTLLPHCIRIYSSSAGCQQFRQGGRRTYGPTAVPQQWAPLLSTAVGPTACRTTCGRTADELRNGQWWPGQLSTAVRRTAAHRTVVVKLPKEHTKAARSPEANPIGLLVPTAVYPGISTTASHQKTVLNVLRNRSCGRVE